MNYFISKLFHYLIRLFFVFIFLCGISFTGNAQEKLRVVVAGLNHDHVNNILHAFKDGRIIITCIAEPNKELWKKYKDLYQLPDSLFTEDLATLVKLKKPDAVLGY